MKNLIITLSILFSSAAYSQFHIGASGAMDVENDIAKLGVGINYMVLPKVTLGAGLMITPFETDGDYEIMYNIKYNNQDMMLVNRSLVIGCDENGDSKDCVSTVEDIKGRIKWGIPSMWSMYG